MASSRHLVLFGGALDTGNLGVAALGTSLIEGVARASADVDITVFDNGWGLRYGSVSAGHQELRYQARGARLSRRYYRSESLQVMYLLAQLGGLGNPGFVLWRRRCLCSTSAAVTASPTCTAEAISNCSDANTAGVAPQAIVDPAPADLRPLLR